MREEFLTTPPRRFSLISTLPAPVLVSPREGSQVQTSADRPVVFRWQRVAGAKSYHFKLYTAANQNDPIFVNFTEDTSQTVPTDTLAEGEYSWTVQAVTPASAVSTQQTGDIGTERFTLRKHFSLTLESPVDGTVLPGLTALRQPTVFRWSTSEEVGRSRFVLSRNSNPLRGRPAEERLNPGQTVSLNRLGEGIWYWTVEAWTPEGIRINAGATQRLRVEAIPLLPAPGNRQPNEGHRISVSELQTQGGLVFSWSGVNGANEYIFTLFRETNGRQQQIVQTNLLSSPTRWIPNKNDITTFLDGGTLVWRVEAVNRRNGTIEQHGRIVVNTFYVDKEFVIKGPIFKHDQ
jgi:hypothetical protein